MGSRRADLPGRPPARLGRASVAVCRASKIIFGVLCLGVGVAFAIGVAELFGEPELGAPAAALFLLGSFLLLRRT
jgi:hypothetical protein